MSKAYDVIVVGAGHAGCEAAAAAANMGSEVLLVTMSMTNMGQMSCNPSIGGIAKGQIVREIDALGGYTGIISDRTMIQFRMLNRSKGPAMWSPRAQNDRVLYSIEWRNVLEGIPRVDFWQDTVTDLVVEKDRAKGIVTGMGRIFYAKSVILANGTFLNGIIHIGEKKFSGGRMGERSSLDLTQRLTAYGFETSRMKTGTPVRVDGRSLDFTRMEEQKGDANPGRFSFRESHTLVNQRSCYLTYTSEEVHEVLKTGFDRSPMFTGRIQGRGPRYCPSIEDKIERFASRDRHQLFIEPEGWNTVEYYVNGFSSSLPEEVQFGALRKVAGFENAKFFRPGYAIEYDYFPPSQLHFSLETKVLENLYFAGQINGTTGYEEAAAQGLMAGINAHLKGNGMAPFILKRSEAYIGVLIDDLITKGTEEPYRMFTSRAEYRILLRQDNADHRLTERSHAVGLAGEEQVQRVRLKYERVNKVIAYLRKQKVEPVEINPFLAARETSPITQRAMLASLLLRPQISLPDLSGHIDSLQQFLDSMPGMDSETLDEVEILIKYETYIEKERELADKIAKLEDMSIPTGFDYGSISSLSMEAREKLARIAPLTIGQASRISGVSPADISVIIVHLGR